MTATMKNPRRLSIVMMMTLLSPVITAFVPPIPSSVTSLGLYTQSSGRISVLTYSRPSRRGQIVSMMSKDLVPFDADLDGSTCRIGIVKTRWNPELVNSLYDGVRTALKECGVKDSNIYGTTVPGSFELPLAARFLALSRQCDVVITIGCLIKGDTMHFEYIAEAVAKGLMDIQLQTTIPVVFGVLTCLTEDQAKARSTGENNHGISWGKTAVEMALLRQAALSKGPERATLDLSEKHEKTSGEMKQERKFGF